MAQSTTDTVFIAKPYLQIGYHPSPTALELMWQAGDANAVWSVEEKASKGSSWKKMQNPTTTKVAVANLSVHYIYRAALTDLTPGTTFSYRVLRNTKVVFTSDAKSLKTADQPYRFVAFGDVGAGTTEAKKIAQQVYAAKPDLVMIPGDIVYDYGLLSEYRTRFWPIYNAESGDEQGAPLIRSIPFVAAPGNHDGDTRDLNKYPDALAYYALWDQPLNGPLGKEGGSLVPTLTGTDQNKAAFLSAAGDAYPRMNNFSFNYGNAHYTFLDADTYVDWTDSTLVKWVANDLAGAANAVWKFVVYHHPGFNSSREHYEQQQMRLLAPTFEKGGVDVVFNGHVHNYQRSFPLHFVPDNAGMALSASKAGKPRGRLVGGRWMLDKAFNGSANTKPNGVIYLVTGAGGQDLYNPEQTNDPDSWQKFTDKFVSTVHSFTVADVNGKQLTIRQLSVEGKQLDSFIIKK